MASVFHLSLFLVFLPPIPDSVQPFLVSPLWLEISTFLISSLHWPTPQTVPLYPPSLPFHHPLMLAGFYFWSAGLISWSPYVTTNSSVRLRSLPTCSGHSFDFQDAEAATLPSPSCSSWVHHLLPISLMWIFAKVLPTLDFLSG